MATVIELEAELKAAKAIEKLARRYRALLEEGSNTPELVAPGAELQRTEPNVHSDLAAMPGIIALEKAVAAGAAAEPARLAAVAELGEHVRETKRLFEQSPEQIRLREQRELERVLAEAAAPCRAGTKAVQQLNHLRATNPCVFGLAPAPPPPPIPMVRVEHIPPPDAATGLRTKRHALIREHVTG